MLIARKYSDKLAKYTRGFTIVELLIVVVVIAILATVTIVGYNGISKRAAQSTLQSDLQQAANQLGITKVDNGVYPADLTSANLKASPGTVFEYTSDGATFCTTASSTKAQDNFFFDSNIGSVQEGKCTGHIGYTTVNGTLGTWASTTIYTTARSYPGAVAYNGYMYVVGGRNGSSNAMTDVQYAPINADGTLGTWTVTSSLPTAVYGLRALAYNGYIYAIGGETGGGASAGVQYAPINANGSIGAWSTTSSLLTGVENFGAVIYNGYMYTLGGQVSLGYTNRVQYAAINANGTLGTWNYGTNLATTRGFNGAVVANGSLYVLAGFNGNSNYTDTTYAAANANGSIGTWATATSTGDVVVPNSVYYGGFIFTMSDGNGAVKVARVNSNGTLSSWTSVTSLPDSRSNFGSALYGKYLYAIGGTNTIVFTSIN